MAIYTLGPLIVIGPVCGDSRVKIIAGSCGVATILGIPLLRETYAPVIRFRMAARSSDAEQLVQQHRHLVQAHGNKFHLLWVNLVRPFTILFRSFICFILSLYMAFPIYYLFFSTFPDFFQETYGFGPGIGGLAYIGLGFGFFLSTFFGARFADGIYNHLVDKNGGKGKPEMRIPALIFGSLFVPVGLFWYGWSAQAKIHWIMPIIGSGIFGLPITLYLVDTFTYAASALAAATVLRSLFGFVFPLFGQQMFDTLGVGGGNSLLGGLAIILGIPFPFYVYYHGEAIRLRSPFSQ
ncbi:major facilitator superfamily domain-containing protein [Mycena sp. CBHHK59/15]|nr:major facilitator superfamily domain-containing protein [Mycena sp. CBHHK59/15]